MTILASEIISDFHAEISAYMPDPSIIPNTRLLRLIDKCQREFAKKGLAFDDIVTRNVVSGTDMYELTDTLLTPYHVEYDDNRIIPCPRGISTPSTVKYYYIYDTRIQLIKTPEEDGTAYLTVWIYRLPDITVSVPGDEIELASKHPEFQDAIVDYLLYETLKSKPEYSNIAEHHWQKYQSSVDDCKSKQRKKTMNQLMQMGL